MSRRASRARRGPLTRDRAGSTLIELLVALAVIGVMLAVAGLALRYEAGAPDPADERTAWVAAYRRQALERRRTVAFTMRVDGRIVTGAAYPDGRVLIGGGVEIDPLSGGARGLAR